MAGEAVISKNEYPDDFAVQSLTIDLSSAVQQQIVLCHDKRFVVDGIYLVGMDPGATSTLRFYNTPAGEDVQGTAGDADHPWVTEALDLDASITGAGASATGSYSFTVVTTANKLEAGDALCFVKTGTPAAKVANVVIRYRSRIS